MNLCRVCTEQRDKDLVSIFSKLDDVLIANIISDCASIQILEGDGLPTNVCQFCIEEVKSTSAFVRKCRESDKKLRKLFEIEEINMPVRFPMIMVDDIHSTPVSKFESEMEIELEPNDLKEEFKTEISEEEEDSESAVDEGEDPSFKVQLKQKLKTRQNKGRQQKKQHETESESESETSDNEVKAPKNQVEKRKYNKTAGILHETVVKYLAKGTLCCSCLREFETDAQMKDHATKAHADSLRKYVNKEKPYPCQVCNKRFAKVRLLENHNTVYSNLKSVYKCTKCDRNFKERRNAMTHAENHPKPRSERNVLRKEKEALFGFICCGPACDRTFKTKEQLIAHSIEHEGNKIVTDEEKLARPFECCYCFKRFMSSKHCNNHQGRKYRRPKYQCTLCGKRLQSVLLLEAHEQMHKGIKPISCEKCRHRFYTAELLRTHMKLTHNSVKKFVCEECGKRFSNKTCLNLHCAVHSDSARKFKCQFCPKTFIVKGALNNHTRVHTGERPFNCKYCDATFAYPGGLSSHEYLHKGKPHCCTFCDKSFVKKKRLENHLANHHTQ